MIDQETYQAIQKELQEGRLSEALDLLLEATQNHDKSLREDVLLLKSKFEYNRNQYEVKGIQTEQEFNIHYSKTVLGAQDVLARLRKGATTNRVRANKRSFILPILALLLLGVGAISWHLLSAPEPLEETQETITTPAIVEDSTSSDTDLKEKQEPVPSPGESVKKQEKPKVSATVDQETAKKPEAEPEKTNEPALPPAKTFEVYIMRNSDMSDADIFVDGEKAVILKTNPIITTIQITQKQGMHVFELRKDGQNCKREQVITEDKQKINFNCP